MTGSGTLDKSYHLGRKTKRSLIYRLNRRSIEVINSINKYYPDAPEDIIDLGTADGLTLSRIKDNFSSARCVGVEHSLELVESSADDRITVLQGDVNALPMPDNSFDIAIATAIIEHLPDPNKMLSEARRVLRPDGLIILTSPDPFWEKIASMIGHLKDDQHNNVMNIKELSMFLDKAGFIILESRKFMLSPVGIPFEIPIETAVRMIGLNFLFANQLVVGQKID